MVAQRVNTHTPVTCVSSGIASSFERVPLRVALTSLDATTLDASIIMF